MLFVTFFSLFLFHLQVDVVGPLLLNASLLLVLTTDYSDWLVQVTELIDNWQWRSFEFWLIIRSFNVEKRSFSVCRCWHRWMCNFSHALKFLMALIFLLRSILQRVKLTRQFYGPIFTCLFIRPRVHPSVCPFVPNLSYFENDWNDFDENWHKWFTGQEHTRS